MNQFWLLTFASSVSKLGNTFLRLAVPLAILHATGSPFAAVLSVAVENVPYLAAPFLGTLIDRLPRRLVFAVSELCQAALVAVLPALLAANLIPAVYLVLLVLSLGAVVSTITSDFGLIPKLAPPSRVGEAYSSYMTCLDVARFAGPALGGLLITTTGNAVALWFDAATFVITAVVALFLKVTAETTSPLESVGDSFRAGWRRFRELPGVVRLTVSLTVYNVGVGSVSAVILALGASAWQWSTTMLGVVVSIGAAVSAAGSAVGGRVRTGTTWHSRVGLWLYASAASSLLMLLPSPWCVTIGFYLMSFAAGAMNVATMAYRHEQIDEAYTGRVNAIVKSFMMGSVPLSSLLLGIASTASTNLVAFLPVVVCSVVGGVVWARGKAATADPVEATAAAA